MLDERMEKALNNQINEELYSAYLYVSMSAHFESQSLQGFAGWMKAQSQEEMLHASKFYQYILDRGGRVELQAIKAPLTHWESPQAAYEAALAHEQHITGCINKLTDLAIELSDHATQVMLQWFVNEQVEEEASVGEFVDKLRLVHGAPGALFLMDQEAAKRTFDLTLLQAPTK